MTVHTPTRTPDTVAHLDTYPTHTQDAFTNALALAEDATNARDYIAAATLAAAILNVPLPPSHDIRVCACSCTCYAVFDPEHPDAHVMEPYLDTGRLGRLQCPACAEDHPETD
ncbi:hypothetical protein [Streptomyces sp. NEAU-H3]|uniref:hypothetical protein n=1 Tax=Streptomyces sp. NEAU-H3 TaxID=2720636 RepID=UPI0014399978|nr:hypothetical protein [Streptomyces sp. NEAU-H3]NJA56708.1 hypothetical protein [Streptomyces sp. NEAU-H3]